MFAKRWRKDLCLGRETEGGIHPAPAEKTHFLKPLPAVGEGAFTQTEFPPRNSCRVWRRSRRRQFARDASAPHDMLNCQAPLWRLFGASSSAGSGFACQ